MPLIGTTEMFKKAYEGHYAIGAFNINNMEIVQGVTDAAADLHSPIILQASAGARKYARPAYLRHLVEAALEEHDIPVALHLDHGADFEICKDCIDSGFTSVMIDASKYDFEDNIALTKKVVDYAHAHGVVVEGELGKLAGIEDDVKVAAADAMYTRPEEVEEFVSRTGVDSLAIAIGTSHGAYKFTPAQCKRNAEGVWVPPELRFDILAQIADRLPNFPIVLHGASSVVPEYVKIINANGGKMPDAIGIPEDQLRKSATMATFTSSTINNAICFCKRCFDSCNITRLNCFCRTTNGCMYRRFYLRVSSVTSGIFFHCFYIGFYLRQLVHLPAL